MHRRNLGRVGALSLAALAFVLVLAAGHAAAKGRSKDLKILKGTWTCPLCDAKGLKGEIAECEDLGHKHALRLSDGAYVAFVENARSEALVTGGGRHNVKIEVCGLYDSSNRKIDVDGYAIDGIWTTWCDAHGRMDMCRGMADADEKASASRDAR